MFARSFFHIKLSVSTYITKFELISMLDKSILVIENVHTYVTKDLLNCILMFVKTIFVIASVSTHVTKSKLVFMIFHKNVR